MEAVRRRWRRWRRWRRQWQWQWQPVTCASCGSWVRSGESSSHSCSAVSIAYSEPACHFDRLSPSITRWSPIPADVRYCRLRVVNVCGISYTYIRSASAAA